MHLVRRMKRATFDSRSLQTVQVAPNSLSNLIQVKRRSCVELNAAIIFGA